MFSGPAKVYIGRLNGEATNYEDLITEGFRFCDFSSSANARVFLKPNLTFPQYRPGVMTSPAAVEATLKVLASAGVKVTVGDSDSGGYNRFSMDAVYAETGLARTAKKYNVDIVNLSRVPTARLSFRARDRILHVELPRFLFDDIDSLLTIPVPKVHMYAGVSLTFKNQWGCIPNPKDRLRLHPYFA